MSTTTTSTLLDIKLRTSPDPPQASPQTGAPRKLSLTFVVSVPETAAQVICDKLTLHFDLPEDDERDDATYLTATGAKVMSDRPADWELETTLPANTFVFKRPQGVDPTMVKQSYTFEIYDIVVSPLVGTALVHVTEHSDTDHAANCKDRERVFEVPKFPPTFGSVDFTPDVTTVDPNGRAKLTWTGDSSADYELTVGDGTPHTVTGTWGTTTDPLTEDTEYRLKVSYQSDGVTVERSYFVTIHVRVPHAELMCDLPTILRGQSTTLTWLVQSVHGCVVEGAPSPEPSIDGLENLKVTPEHTTTYALSCKTKSGATYPSNDVKVEVLQRAPQMVADLFFIRTEYYDGLVEVKAAQGSTHLQGYFATTETDVAGADGQDGIWMMAHFLTSPGTDSFPRLIFIRTRNTSSGFVEARYLSNGGTTAPFVTTMHYQTPFPEAKAANGTWRLSASDLGMPDQHLVLIQSTGTASGKVEVSYAMWGSVAVNRTWTSMYPAGDQGSATWFWAKMTPTSPAPDLVCVQTSDTDSGWVELSYATAASNYLKLGRRWVTDFDTADAANGIWQLVDVDDDQQLELVFVKTKNTRSGRIEVYVARPGDNYKIPTGGYTWFGAAEGSKGQWQLALWYH